ncbi:methyltransferase domain-containing protein [Methylocapsa sp. S129]|uniref:methyltransferase domain-containing protein n=1 Tax=Methylocapsa sp. S129 TaxID=1641869 RepID=UPI00131B2D6D|nr:methyltransferase domain-containing protein [Methylocapsa sp. S129]
MHASSLENMRACYHRFVENGPLAAASDVIVLDIGAADVNGSYREIFSDSRFHYIGADLAAGDGVSLVLENPYKLPIDDASIDVVLSGQMLEHWEFFWLAFAEMARVLKPGGYIFLVAPSAGPIQRCPVDCYRFYPDAYAALAKYANCQLVDVWLDERGPWNDLVGVFRRHALPPSSPLGRPAANAAYGPGDPPNSPEEEATKGDASYLDVLAGLHRDLAPSLYLEIGVRHGHSLKLAQCEAIGVDPKPDIKVGLPLTARIETKTSDDFFEDLSHTPLENLPDLVFIDGLHLFEYALRDFMHVERLTKPGALVVFDDIFPNHSTQAARVRRSRVWAGDVWKIYACLRQWRQDLFLLPINASPTGLLLVAGLDSGNRVLWSNYNSIVRSYADERLSPPDEILNRAEARSAASLTLPLLAETLKAARAEARASDEVVQMLRLRLSDQGS